MAKSYISITGLYNYDNDLFHMLVLPDGINRQDVIDSICMECADLELLYPSQPTMRYAIGLWSRKNLLTWKKLFDSTMFEYNPIWNKDGTYTDVETRNLQNTVKSSGEQNTSGDSTEESENTTSVTTKVSAFNSDNFENREKQEGETSLKTASESKNNTDFENHSAGTDTGTVIREHKEQGNIGVTTTQQMIREEREIVQFNVIDCIVKSFKKEFCIEIY